MMKEFFLFLGVVLSFILLPVYFCWLMVCIAQGHWITLNMFSWDGILRVSVVIWTIFVTIGTSVTYLENN